MSEGTRMYNYVRGRRPPSSATSSTAAAAGPLALAAAERDASNRAGDSASRPTDDGVDDDDDDDAEVGARPPAGLRRRRVAAAAAPRVPPSGSGPSQARSPSHALRDAVERVARELGINPSNPFGADASPSNSASNSDRSAWDDVDEAGAPTPEALVA